MPRRRVNEIDVRELAFDEENSDKLARHGITVEQAVQHLDNGYIIAVNRRNRRANHVLVGRDNGGACIAMPLEPTSDPDVWRPITAWYCKGPEELALRRSGRG